MIFDQLCGVVERHLPEYLNVLSRAALFVFNQPAQEIFKERPGFHKEFDPSLFFLPFPVVAIEDPAGLVILADKEEQLGLDKTRFFMEVQPISLSSEVMDSIPEIPERSSYEDKAVQDLLSRHPKALSINTGTLNGCELNDNGKFATEYTGKRMLLADKKTGIIYEEDHPGITHMMQPSARNVTVALEELALLSRPSDFIMETTQIKKQKVKLGSIPRTHQRPLYSILEPAQIRKTMGIRSLAKGAGKVKMPHERRRHFRRYEPGPGKPWKESKLVVIDACWIGSSESVVRNKRYKVRLDA